MEVKGKNNSWGCSDGKAQEIVKSKTFKYDLILLNLSVCYKKRVMAKDKLINCGMFLVFLGIFVLIFSGIVSAEGLNCWMKTGTNSSACTAISGCVWRTNTTDPFCMNSVGCCMDLNCGMYAGNQAACQNTSDSLSCVWILL